MMIVPEATAQYHVDWRPTRHREFRDTQRSHENNRKRQQKNNSTEPDYKKKIETKKTQLW
jgi:hypothetical protein